MTGWRFYGREKDLEKLELNLRLHENTSNFDALRIIGRRGVGTTEFVKEAARRGTGEPPVLHVELPSPQEADGEAACEMLKRAAIQAGLSNAFGTLPDRNPYRYGGMWFEEILRCLIQAGTVVVLDEFHHARPLGLESGIKLVIDGFTCVGAPRVSGKLVMMGSHQKQLLYMFRSDQPLFQRATASIRLAPWPVGTVLEMAAEQGFLRHPGRFLTLWTAYGGVPKHWHRFADSNRFAKLREFSLWPDDAAWRRAFIDNEREFLADPEERFDSRSFVELAPQQREVLLWLAHNRPRGATLEEVEAGLGKRGDPTVLESLELLQDHLGLVQLKGQFLVKGTGRWRIIDNNTMFQISVHPGIFDDPASPMADGGSAAEFDRQMTALADNEGPALERFAAACFGEMSGITWSDEGLWRQRRPSPFTDPSGRPLPPLADIDVMARRGQWSDPEPVFILAGCKRNAGRHQPSRLVAQFREFLDDLGPGADASRFRALAKERYLISSEFTDRQRRRAAEAGFACLGIRDMAREIGINPGPEPGNGPEPRPTPNATAARRTPAPEDGPSFGIVEALHLHGLRFTRQCRHRDCHPNGGEWWFAATGQWLPCA